MYLLPTITYIYCSLTCVAKLISILTLHGVTSTIERLLETGSTIPQMIITLYLPILHCAKQNRLIAWTSHKHRASLRSCQGSVRIMMQPTDADQLLESLTLRVSDVCIHESNENSLQFVRILLLMDLLTLICELFCDLSHI